MSSLFYCDDSMNEREYLEWLAEISPQHESELRRALREKAEPRTGRDRELLEFVDAITGRRPVVPLGEAGWDASKHPRLGGPPNAGWFASTGRTGDGRRANSQRSQDPAETVREVLSHRGNFICQRAGLLVDLQFLEHEGPLAILQKMSS